MDVGRIELRANGRPPSGREEYHGADVHRGVDETGLGGGGVDRGSGGARQTLDMEHE